MECFKITGSRGSAWAYIQMRIYIFPALTATNAKRLCEGGLIVFVWIVFAVRLCSGAVGLLPSVQPVHHRHQIESQMSADVLLTIFTASPSREQLFLFSR